MHDRDSHAELRRRSLGEARRDTNYLSGDRTDNEAVEFDDPRFFSQQHYATASRHQREAGARDKQGGRIYSGDQ